ncbi:DinB family protein [Chitinophaga pendula]|uniref:DinB family protein n=1 Tax=Chitinophaga TaxID=79328 RepID=UPI000BB07054|nr:MULTISPECIES: DinB family protein [Chitinophaga]ASZ10370.1 damage-inducible protein DinB [Chitinophaga sp. MD30]UCJ06665.1 DinB family protein [Chitinophaga pendula]
MIQTSKQTRTLATLVKDYAAYNAWANKTLINWLRTKPEELMDASVASSFHSINKTLQHYLEAQQYWLAIIKDEAPELSTYQRTAPIPTAALFDLVVEQSAAFSDFVATLNDEDLQESVLIVTEYFQSNRDKFEYIQHVMNHSTYHRGQIVTMGRHIGLTDAPMTDYNFFLLMA